MQSITYPSGTVIGYRHNANERIASVSVTAGDTTWPLAIDIAYRPFGPVSGLVYGNGIALARTCVYHYDPTGHLLGESTLTPRVTRRSNAIGCGSTNRFR